MIIAVLNALIAIPRIAGLVQMVVQTIVSWYMQKQTSEALSAIADAAALGARAQTDADRYAAALAWKTALSKSRFIA